MGIVRTSQVGNIAAGMPTDCPTREKHGWLGDAQTTAEEALYNLDMAAIYTEFLRCIADDQTDTGDVPGVVPAPPRKHAGARVDDAAAAADAALQGKSKAVDISWTAAFPLIARWMLQYYGDVAVLTNVGMYDALSAYMDNLVSIAHADPSGVAACYIWGDWCCIEARSVAVDVTGPPLATFNYVLALDAMSQVAAAVGKAGDAARYAALAAKARPLMHARYWSPANKTYTSHDLDLQSLTAAPLGAGGVVPAALQEHVVGTLVGDITGRGNHLTFGSVGAKWVLRALTQVGHHDVAMAMATQTTQPSWGYWLAQGATSCWEDWSGVADPTHPPMPTHNHIFLCGGLGEWAWRDVVGIQPAVPSAVPSATHPGSGYDAAVIAPHVLPAAGPSSAQASLATVRGSFAVGWSRAPSREAGAADVNVTVVVPPGPPVTVVVPSVGHTPGGAGSAWRVVEAESGALVWAAGAFKGGPGVTAGAVSAPPLPQGVAFTVASGSYRFVAAASS